VTSYGMTDQNRVNTLLQALFTSSTTFTVTPGTGGGAAFTITPPYKLLLMGTVGSNTVDGTQLAAGSGYATGGASMGATAFNAPSAGVVTNANVISWAATGTWSTVNGIEVWDSATTSLRWLQGAVNSPVSGVVNGDTVQFAAGSITANASSW
jgi:hypothetical protein